MAHNCAPFCHHLEVTRSFCLRRMQNDDIFDRMRSTAYDMATPGYDPGTGYGFIAGDRLLVSWAA